MAGESLVDFTNGSSTKLNKRGLIEPPYRRPRPREIGRVRYPLVLTHMEVLQNKLVIAEVNLLGKP